MTPEELRRVQARLPSVLPYMRLMVEIRREMRRAVQAELLRPLETIVRLDAADDYAQRFANLEVKWAQATSEKALGKKLRAVAEQTQAHAAREQARILRRPIEVRGKVYRADIWNEGYEEQTREFVRENVNLVTKMSREQLSAMKDLVNESTQAQWSYKELRARIIEQFGLSKSRAALIARDQTLKHNAQVTRRMHEDAGIRRYRWVTSRDERVRGTPGGRWPRGLHYSLDGQVFSYDEPPVVDARTGRRENPGGDYSCRCTAVPLTDDLLYPDDDEIEIEEPPPPVVVRPRRPRRVNPAKQAPSAEPEVRHYPYDRKKAVELVEERNEYARGEHAAGEYAARSHIVLVPISRIDVPPVWEPSKLPPIQRALAEGKELPWVRLELPDGRTGQLSITDGIHRINAAREAGYTHVPALVEEAVELGSPWPEEVLVIR